MKVERMKVVLVSHHYPPVHIGGVELIVERIARWLTQQGHQVEVVCVENVQAAAADRVTARQDVVDGVAVHRLQLELGEIPYTLGLIYRNERLGDWMRDLLNRSRPDVVDVHSCYLTSTSVIDAARSLGLPVLLTLHDYWFLCPWMALLKPDGRRCPGARSAAECAWCLLTDKRRYRISDRLLGGRLASWSQRAMERETALSRALGWDGLHQFLRERRRALPRILEGSGRVIAKSPFLKQKLTEAGVAAGRIQVLTSGLDMRQWQRSSGSRYSRNGMRIGYLGQISPRKGVHLLIEAFNQLQVSGPQPELRIHGHQGVLPDYSQWLSKLSAGNDRIVFTGGYENAQVAEILSQIDLVVVPSQWYETGPLVTLEAFASRTPVVATDLPNMNNQVTHDGDGLLFAPGDAEDLARQLQRAVDEPDLIPRLAANIGPVKTFEEEMGEILALYETICEREGSRPGELPG
jgi:glycosyltransferase involved in cell wall biosynthesis